MTDELKAKIADLISMANCRHITDRFNNITDVIIPFEVWVELMEAVEIDDE